MLVITNMYPPHALGGYEQSCHDVVERLRARGHDVLVLTTTMRRTGVAGGAEAGVRRELEFYWSDHVLLDPPPLRRLTIERHNQRVLRQALRDFGPDVGFIWNMGAMSLGLLTTLHRRRLPLVYAVCDDWLSYGPRIDPWIQAWSHRPRLARLAEPLLRVPTRLPVTLGRTGTFCFVSDHTRRHAESTTPWSFEHAEVVGSGISGDDFPLVGRADDRPWRWRLLYVGRVEPRKGVEDAVRALAGLPPEATLDLVGALDPTYAPALQRVVDELRLGDRVRLTVARRDQLAAIYRDADVVLFPPVWEEPFGLVPLEAMACGTAVVATATGGSREFLRDGGNCLVVPKHDPAAIADAVRRLQDDPQLRTRLRDGGLATAARYSVDALADTFEHRLLAA